MIQKILIAISTRISKLPPPDLAPYRLSDSYTKYEVRTNITDTFNVISTRITNLPLPQNYGLLPATSAIRGGIRVGNGLSINADVFSSATFLLPIKYIYWFGNVSSSTYKW